MCKYFSRQCLFTCIIFLNPHNNQEVAIGQPFCHRCKERGNGQSTVSVDSVQALCLHSEWNTQLVLLILRFHIYRCKQLQAKTLVRKPCIWTEYVQKRLLVLIPSTAICIAFTSALIPKRFKWHRRMDSGHSQISYSFTQTMSTVTEEEEGFWKQPSMDTGHWRLLNCPGHCASWMP